MKSEWDILTVAEKSALTDHWKLLALCQTEEKFKPKVIKSIAKIEEMMLKMIWVPEEITTEIEYEATKRWNEINQMV